MFRSRPGNARAAVVVVLKAKEFSGTSLWSFQWDLSIQKRHGKVREKKKKKKEKRKEKKPWSLWFSKPWLNKSWGLKSRRSCKRIWKGQVVQREIRKGFFLSFSFSFLSSMILSTNGISWPSWFSSHRGTNPFCHWANSNLAKKEKKRKEGGDKKNFFFFSPLSNGCRPFI